jgi:hypothetical protein
VYTVFALHSPSHTLSPPPHPFCWYQPPRQDLSYPPVLLFCKREKKWHFYLLKIATWGVSLWQ